MDLFLFVVCLLVMLLSLQYKLYWLMLLIGGILVFVGKTTKTFILVSVVMFILYIISGTAYEQYSMYVAAGGIVAYMLLNKNEQQQDTYNPNDQYADLLKGLGGGGPA